MALKKFYIKVRRNWSKKFEWGTDSNKIYKDDYEIGKANSLQDAIDIAKSDCGADENSIVEVS